MQTPVTAWRNGCVMADVGFTAQDIESYRAIYCKVFDWPNKAARFSNGHDNTAIIMAVEDARYVCKICL